MCECSEYGQTLFFLSLYFIYLVNCEKRLSQILIKQKNVYSRRILTNFKVDLRLCQFLNYFFDDCFDDDESDDDEEICCLNVKVDVS